MPTETLFKCINPNGFPLPGEFRRWNLPKNGNPGLWMPRIVGKLNPGENGYYLCRIQRLVEWLSPEIYLAEYRGERIDTHDNIVVREARLIHKLDTWNERSARLFACNCAEHVLLLFEKARPDDRRPRQAIETARKFANGEATAKQLAAANDAARDAVGFTRAWTAVEWAAWATVGAADSDAVGSTASNAAREAASDAAGKAAGATAWYAEHDWQTARLMEYLGMSEASR